MLLDVSVEINGSFEHVGKIITKQAFGGVFQYGSNWIEKHPDMPLSISLPVSNTEFKARQIKPYFAGLLPEGQALVEIANRLHVSIESYLRILRALGDECIGAVRIVDVENEHPLEKPSYKPLSEEGIERISTASFPRSAQLNANAKLSIAGAQSKTGLYIDPETGEFFLPKDTAPSNWIAKPASERFDSLIDNEFFCMSLAKSCGINVAECQLSQTETRMLLIKRFDRLADPEMEEIDGHRAFARLHQEDFCQALGVQSSKKYEDQHTSYASKSGELLRSCTTDVVENIKGFFVLVLFNYLIGNCDAHLKNYSLLRSTDWSSLGLSPAYDLVSTAVYDELGTGLAMHVGKAKRLEDVSVENFLELGDCLKLSKKVTISLLDEFCDCFREGLKICTVESEVAEKIKRDSFERAARLSRTQSAVM